MNLIKLTSKNVVKNFCLNKTHSVNEKLLINLDDKITHK